MRLYMFNFSTILSVQNSQARIAICHSKLSWLLLKIEFGQQISYKSCYSSPSYKIKNSVYLEYCIMIIATQLLQIVTQLTI